MPDRHPDSRLDAQLRAINARIPAWSGQDIEQIEAIGGLTNMNYRVTVNGEAFVLRVSERNVQRLGIDRRCEYKAL